MKAKLYRVKDGYIVINHEGMIFSIIPQLTGKLWVQSIGKGKEFEERLRGQLLKNIPNFLKEIFFKLNKKV